MGVRFELTLCRTPQITILPSDQSNSKLKEALADNGYNWLVSQGSKSL